MTNGYYRFPTIYNRKVFFVCEDDLWEVSIRGGAAKRLTSNLGRVSSPAASPDGKWLAFVGREDGYSEVYVMPLGGGPATRLTFFGGVAMVLGWSKDSQEILFSNDANQPFARLRPVYTVNRKGGQPQQIPVGPAHAMSYGPQDGQVVIGRGAADLANWKRYRGGRAGDVWLDAKGDGKFKPILKQIKGNMACPMWLNDRIYFLSDHEGIANIYSCPVGGKRVQRHTHHEDYYVRNPATDGQRIVYRAGGDLYVLDPQVKGEQAYQQVKVRWQSPQVQRNRKFVGATSYLDHYTVHPKGHSVAFVSRGKPFALSNWEGAVSQYGQRHGVRYRLSEWLNDGERLLLVSDAEGEEALEVHSQPDLSTVKPTKRGRPKVGPKVERLAGLNIGRPHFLSISPTTDAVVFGNHRFELLHLDLASKTLRCLDKSNHARISKASWSPDGCWVAYDFRTSFGTGAIKVCEVATGETHFVTAPNHVYDFSPSFDPEGKYLYFISLRDFNPVPDSHYFEWSFPHGGRPYLITLQQDLPNPFIPLPNGLPADNGNGDKNGEKKDETSEKAKDKKGKTKKKDEAADDKNKKKEKPPTQIDFAGIQRRVIAFPVPEGRYFQIEGINKSRVLFSSYPVEGRLGGAWLDENNGPKGALELYDLKDRRKDFLISGVSRFKLSRERNHLVYYNGSSLRVLKAGDKVDASTSGFNRKAGWIDLNRAKVAINPPAEWQQMFREAWRLQRDHFWTEDMSSVDWELVYERYYPLVDRVASRSEFSDLMWEMQGELGTSHAYEMGGDYRTPPFYSQGVLGADFVYDANSNGYRISQIVQGDSWLEWMDSPLNRLGVNAKVGDILLAIDGQPLSEQVTPEQLLVNRGRAEVALTLLSPNGWVAEKPAKKKKKKKKKTEEKAADPIRIVLVKTLHNDRMARYREWVERNRQQVHTATDGKVGYVHIPDMGAFGFSEFHRYYLAESEREGLIVDVRFNGGGNVSQLLLEKLARRRLGYKKARYRDITPYPYHSVLGPMVALTNEFAGSDGDIFSHAFKLLELGPLIGKRTWGGVIGISPQHGLVDGSLTTQPEFSSWFNDVGWAVENYGTDPDIEVDIRPQDYASGKDPQMDRGIKEILKLMRDNPPRIPDFGPRPNLALPKLPRVKRRK